MKRSSCVVVLLLLIAACSTSNSNDPYGNGRGRNGRYRAGRQNEIWGTVRSVDRGDRRIDLDFVDSNGAVRTESVYYDEQNTSFERGVRYDEVRRGDRILVRGHRTRGRWMADSVLRSDR
jgi:hypothetical protein